MKKHVLFAALTASLLAQSAWATDSRNYTVTVTNITKGVSFTPILFASHKKSTNEFKIGNQASDALTAVAESGDTSAMQTVFEAQSHANTASTSGLLAPGQSTTIELSGNYHSRRVSMVSMLLPTNDTFVSLANARLPKRGSKTYYARAYDAGSETNDELCAHIPGPTCNGEALSPNDNGEGFIYPSPSTHGEGDLSRQSYQWNGAVAKIVIKAH